MPLATTSPIHVGEDPYGPSPAGLRWVQRRIFGALATTKVILAGTACGLWSAWLSREAFVAEFAYMPPLYLPPPGESLWADVGQIAAGSFLHTLFTVGLLAALVGILLGRYLTSRGFREGIGFTLSGRLFARQALAGAIAALWISLILAEAVGMSVLHSQTFHNWTAGTNRTVMGVWSLTRSRIIQQIGPALAQGTGGAMGELIILNGVIGLACRVVLPIAFIEVAARAAWRARSRRAIAVRVLGVSVALSALVSLWESARLLFDRLMNLPGTPHALRQFMFIEPDVIVAGIVGGILIAAATKDYPE